MSKPTIRDLIERAYKRESGVVLAERVEAVLQHLDGGEEVIWVSKAAIKRILNGGKP